MVRYIRFPFQDADQIPRLEKYQDDPDLLLFAQSGVRLGNVLSRLVHFDGAEPQMVSITGGYAG